jgi:hypothetical protein
MSQKKIERFLLSQNKLVTYLVGGDDDEFSVSYSDKLTLYFSLLSRTFP